MNENKQMIIDTVDIFMGKHEINDLFTMGTFYLHITGWLLLSLLTILCWWLVFMKPNRRQSLGLKSNITSGERITTILIALTANHFASIFILETLPGILLFTQAKWLWTLLDLFYTVTTFRIFFM